jgi:photosystem II stability/assembly factor-like uncharacterized protein
MSYKYRGICVINDSLVWVVGESGRVWKRTDGIHSHNWVQLTNLPSEYTDYHLNDVCFVDADKGWIVGEKKVEPNKYQGVIYYTPNDGANWFDQTGNVSPPLPLPTPFLKVRMVQVGPDYHGYIACGNGVVLKTDDGGATWSRCKTPWNTKDSISVWYDGLGLVDGSNLWVSGDAFGVVSKSTDAGANWTAYQPDVFKQNYTFPSGTVTPYDTRLANLDAQFTNTNTGCIALSYGKIGKTTNAGTTWDTIRYEPNPVWFHGSAILSDSETYVVGTHHVVNVSGTQEHNLDNESHTQFATVPLYCTDFSSNKIGYAAGKGSPSYYSTILQGYDPAGFVFDGTVVNAVDRTIEVYWHTTFETNTDKWGIKYRPMMPFVQQDNSFTIPAAGHASSYACTTSFLYNEDCRWYYLDIKLYTNDYTGPWPFQLCYGPEEIEKNLRGRCLTF